MYKIEYLQTAKDDMDNIIKYISYKLHNPISATKLATDFIKEINNVVIFPYGNNKTPNRCFNYSYNTSCI